MDILGEPWKDILISPIETTQHLSISPEPSTCNKEVPGYQSKQNAAKQLPPGVERPICNYYTDIDWGEGFENWNLVRFSTPMDGNCLFHAISNGFFIPYYTQVLDGEHVPRAKIISILRESLSEKLAEPISPNSTSHYNTLSGGNILAFSKDVPEFSLEHMQQQLNSQTSIGYGYMEFIGNSLNKDIYILEALRRSIYVTDELSFTIKGNRNSIVLYYANGHYELVGIQNKDGSFSTHFSCGHTFIMFLRNKVANLS